MPPIGRLLAVVASFIVGWASDHNLTLSEPEVTAIMLGVYGASHTAYRKWRANRDMKSEISANQLPKGTL